VSSSQVIWNFTNLKAWLCSILKTTSYSFEYSCTLFHYSRWVGEHLNVLSETREHSPWLISGYLTSSSYGYSSPSIEYIYTLGLVSAHIGTDRVNVFLIINMDTESKSATCRLQGIESWWVVSKSRRCIPRWAIHRCVWWWMFKLHGVHTGSLGTAVSRLICIA
jgi:hypothetical protein